MCVLLCFVSLCCVSSLAAGEIPWASRQGHEDGWTAPPQVMDGEFGDVAREIVSFSEGLRRALSQGLKDNESQCFEDFESLFNTTDPFWNVSQGELALDAFGKPGPNIVYGNVHLVGSFDECLDIGEGLTKYCVISLSNILPTCHF